MKGDSKLPIKKSWRAYPCKEWVGAKNDAGYGLRRCKIDGRKQGAHRATWREEVGPIPAGLHVLHRCDNPPCQERKHLFLGTHSDNMKDRSAKGRWAGPDHRGVKNPAAKLSLVQVGAIRAEYAAGSVSQGVLAAKYNVSRQLVGLIVQRKIWV